jgi:hypothetical protein
MIKFEATKVFNFEGAFHGLRNPMNSWDKSDSVFGTFWGEIDGHKCFDSDGLCIGKNDLNLAQRMISGGTEQSKFLRQIFISTDITAPLFFWKQLDTYKVNTVRNSCSTMHKIASSPITESCFSFTKKAEDEDFNFLYKKYKDSIIDMCETLRIKYLETKNQDYWRALIEILPESWNQKATWTANYQVLRNIYHQRKNHKLPEWHEFCDMIEKLPYGKELITYKE